MPRSRTVLRAIDANLNRSREAARVLEDWVRFARDDASAAAQLKQLRSTLAGIEMAIGTQPLLATRDTAGDVGTTLTSPTELRRPSEAAVVAANFRRLGEALRSLEEFCKLAAPELAPQIERERYAAYVLEQRLLLGGPRAVLERSGVMLVASKQGCKQGYVEVLRAAWGGGVRCFQLREKEGSDRERLEILREGATCLRGLGEALVVVNDRVDLCLAVGADGVHLGKTDMPLAAARELLGEHKVIGVSTRTSGDVAGAEGADYLGAGAMFPSSTKLDTTVRGPAWGVEASGLAHVPVFCIGGVGLSNAPELKAAGVRRIAVGSAICGADAPERAAEVLVSLFAVARA